MGGRAFANHNPPLSTPRMPLEIYSQVLSRTLSILRGHYTYADSPIEAPGKASYGDVDCLVAEPANPSLDFSQTSRRAVAESLASILSAKSFIVEQGNPTINLAVAWPGSPSTASEANRYIQIDVHICPTATIFAWELFHSAHGDLWNILGSTIRPFGLTANDVGLFLRIPEIELHDRKKSMVFLTDSPSKVLELLGLDEERWWKTFDSQDEMFEYAAGCRLFWVKEIEDGENYQRDGADKVSDIEAGAQEGGEQGRKTLKHNDRARMSKRPIFKAWIDEFIPKCRAEGRFSTLATSNALTRLSLRDEIFAIYPIKEEYESRLQAWSLLRHQDELWRDVIKGSVPIEDVNPALRAAAIRQLKAVIMEKEQWDGKVADPAMTDEKGFYDIDAVRNFVLENWRRAGELGLVKTQAQARQGIKIKAEKKAAREAGDHNYTRDEDRGNTTPLK
jgi:hypothetical protein